MADRAILFIDGNNWYHSLRDAGVPDLGRLDYSKISRKVVGPREWIETRYYIGQVQQHGNRRLYADQRAFLAYLRATDRRISVHLGRLESRPFENPCATELKQLIAALDVRIDTRVFHQLVDLARRHGRTEVFVEKAVDVMVAVDMVVKAERNEFDAAYLFSGDGDFTPAVKAVRDCSKKVYIVSPAMGAQLAGHASSYIRIDRQWLVDCYA